MRKFEHMRKYELSILLPKELDQLSSEGWELVAERFDQLTVQFIYIFRRELK